MTREGRARLDPGDAAAARALRRLEEETAGWLATVAPDGTPQTTPVWFIWDDDDFYMYSKESPRVRNIRSNPRVSFNLDGDRKGGEVVVIEGSAVIDQEAPSVAENQQYLAKYGAVMADRDWTPEWFGARYPVFIRVTPTRFRYW